MYILICIIIWYIQGKVKVTRFWHSCLWFLDTMLIRHQSTLKYICSNFYLVAVANKKYFYNRNFFKVFLNVAEIVNTVFDNKTIFGKHKSLNPLHFILFYRVKIIQVIFTYILIKNIKMTIKIKMICDTISSMLLPKCFELCLNAMYRFCLFRAN